MKSLPELSILIEFHFKPNQYFTNLILTKKYFMKCDYNKENPFSFDGAEIYKSKGSTINWNDGMDVTIKTIKKKQQHGRGKTFIIDLIFFSLENFKILSCFSFLLYCQETTPRKLKQNSFFNYFVTLELPEDVDDPKYNEINVRNEFFFLYSYLR